jgi:hypothetical protein
MPKAAVTRINGAFQIQPKTVTSVNNGFYAPQLTQTQINNIPASVLQNGAIVYNTTTNIFQVFQNGQWATLTTGLTNVTVGFATLGPGNVTVNTSYVAANSNIFLQTQGTIGTANSGNVRVSAITPGTSFIISSSNPADTSIVRWFIVN